MILGGAALPFQAGSVYLEDRFADRAPIVRLLRKTLHDRTSGQETFARFTMLTVETEDQRAAEDRKQPICMVNVHWIFVAAGEFVESYPIAVVFPLAAQVGIIRSMRTGFGRIAYPLNVPRKRYDGAVADRNRRHGDQCDEQNNADTPICHLPSFDSAPNGTCLAFSPRCRLLAMRNTFAAYTVLALAMKSRRARAPAAGLRNDGITRWRAEIGSSSG
jgi:hypothetical protein